MRDVGIHFRSGLQKGFDVDHCFLLDQRHLDVRTPKYRHVRVSMGAIHVLLYCPTAFPPRNRIPFAA